MTSPDVFARRLVSLHVSGTGGCYGVCLSAPGLAPVVIGRTANPAIAREWVAAARRSVAAALRAAREEAESLEVTEDFLTEMMEPSTGGGGGRLVGLPD